MDAQTLANLRVDYRLRSFNEQDLVKDPLQQFSQWFDEALNAHANEPNAMTLATVKPDGSPSARIVLLKGLQEEGFVFFTNYDSHKGMELEQHPRAALVFCWLELQRQVRVEGLVKKIPAAESDTYFYSRPLGSRIGAHASPQSKVIAGRDVLEQRYADTEARFQGQEVPRPANWGGYVVVPHSIEFWQGRQSRLHDRFLFTRQAGKEWLIERLAP